MASLQRPARSGALGGGREWLRRGRSSRPPAGPSSAPVPSATLASSAPPTAAPRPRTQRRQSPSSRSSATSASRWISPGGRTIHGLFVVEQGGTIRIVRDGSLVETPLLDIGGIVTAGGEQGLLGLAFHPDPADPRFFVYYTALDGEQVVASYETTANDRDRADPDSERVILRMADRFDNHNGGGLAFGPEGYLYIATGDGRAGAIRSIRAGTSTRRWPRSCASTSTRGPGLAVHDPGRQPVPDRWCPPGDLADRPAQPLAHPLRPGYGRPLDRRRRAERSRGDRRGSCRRRGLDFGWNVMEGSACFRDPGTDCLTDA